MAHLNWHGKIVAVYQHNIHPDVRIHITENGTVLRTTGKRNGKAKVVRIDTTSMKEGRPILSTLKGIYADRDNPLVIKMLAESYYLL